MSKFIDLEGLKTIWAKVKSLISTAQTTVGNYTINGKKISSNPTLSAADVSAIPTSQKGAVNGVATLGSDGKLTSAQLPALKTVNGSSIVGSGNISIDLSLYKVVTTLPTQSIDTKKIYLVLSASKGTQNTYTEYIYVDSKWEKLGEYKADVDLTAYAKKSDAIGKYTPQASTSNVKLLASNVSGGAVTEKDATINAATKSAAGVMSASDKDTLDHLDVIAKKGILTGFSAIQAAGGDGETVNFELPYTMDSGDAWDNGALEVTIPAATSSDAGVMTAEDKQKLDDIEIATTTDINAILV